MKQHHRARRLALQGLCCLDVQGDGAAGLVRQFIDDSTEQPETLAGARELLEATVARRAECDEVLARHAKHWDLSRLALVDRNILRLAVTEMRSGKTPPKVAITEAIRRAQAGAPHNLKIEVEVADLAGLEDAREEAIRSPWGEPSAPVRHGSIAGMRCALASRVGHRFGDAPAFRGRSASSSTSGTSKTGASRSTSRSSR